MSQLAKILPYEVQSAPTEEELKNDFAVSARTSIFRKTAAAPLKILIKNGYLKSGSCINYGKGKYDVDSLEIRKATGFCVDYDYTYCRADVLGGSYNMLYSGYVVNTLPIASRMVVWREMAKCVSNGGVAYVAARSDNGIKGKEYEDGFISSIGTFQRKYQGDDLAEEAKKTFEFVEYIKSPSGFHIVRCSHKPFDII